MVKVEINKKILDGLDELFKEEPKKRINTRRGILKAMDNKMRECLISEEKQRRKKNYSGALINENYFFSLFFLREKILGRDLNIHKERKRLRRIVKDKSREVLK